MTIYANPRRRVVHDPHPEFADATAISRFWSLVERGADDDCWLWTGYVDRSGYGLFSWRGTRRPAHELALSFSTGEKRLPSLETCHSCDNPPCCNPAHLRFDTRQSNVADAVARGRLAKSNRKLSDRDVIAIRQRRAMGARQKDLALAFGVTDGTISEVVRGLKFRDVGGPIEHKRAQYRKGVSA